MRKKESNDVKKYAIGAGVAAIAGYLAGILTAPKSGKQTRDDLQQTAKKGVTEAEKEIKKLHDELDGLMADVKEKSSNLSGKTTTELTDLVDKAKVSKDKASELLKALRKGDAEDKELNKAISEANKAIEHVRKYLQK